MVFPIDNIPAKAHVYGMIFTLANRLQCVGDRRDDNVTTMQCFLIANLTLFDDYELNLGEIAKMLGTSRQNVKKMAGRLQKKGYVTLQKDREDGRNIRAALTQKGKEYYRIRASRESEYLERLFKGLDEDMIVQMKKGFGILLKNTGKIEKLQSEKEN